MHIDQLHKLCWGMSIFQKVQLSDHSSVFSSVSISTHSAAWCRILVA